MSSQGPLPYLKFCDVEIANAARTLSYMRNGLGDTSQGRWVLGDGDLCGVLYRVNGGDCLSPDIYASPAADPAPWYDPNEAASEKFLGLVMLDIDANWPSARTRVVTPRIGGLGGASFSGERRAPRTFKFRAAMVSADDQGAEYGERWLESALGATECDTCASCEMTLRMACPDGDCSDDTVGQWTWYDVVLTEGPQEVEKWSPRPSTFDDTMAGCRDIVVLEWTMVAGNPRRYKPSAECLPAEVIGTFDECDDICEFLFGDPGEPHCCEVEPPARGALGAIFTLQSVSGMNNVLLGAYETCPAGTDDGDPIFEMEISGVPANGTVVVDGARQRITVTVLDADTGELVTSDGQSLIVIGDEGVQWVQARDCDDITCFCARTAHPCSQGGDTLVSISTQLREG